MHFCVGATTVSVRHTVAITALAYTQQTRQAYLIQSLHEGRMEKAKHMSICLMLEVNPNQPISSYRVVWQLAKPISTVIG